jgi:2-polyprenyl-3-methyl-5-hydroxy-6-metoxy-1,4-benzoquinol methylase
LNILDLGSGAGWLASALTTYGRVTGVEPSPGGVKRARELYGEKQNLRFICGDAASLLARDLKMQELFDIVVSSEVIEHVTNQTEFLLSIRPLLKSDGLLLLSTPRKECWDDWTSTGQPKQPIENWVSEAKLKNLVRDAGYSVITHLRRYANVQTSLFSHRLHRRTIADGSPFRILAPLARTLFPRACLYQFLLAQKTPGAVHQ